MSEAPTVTYESVSAAIEALQNEGRQVSQRAVREKLGRGSFASIQPLLKQILSASPAVPPETEERWRPTIKAASEAARMAVQEAVEGLKAENTRLQKDLDDTNSELAAVEAARAEAETEIERLKAEATRQTIKLESAEKTLAEIKSELDGTKREAKAEVERIRKETEVELEKARREAEEVRRELTKVKIREDDWKEAKAEAAEAREKAARLEGRLEELEKANKPVVDEPAVKSAGGKNKSGVVK